MPGLMSLLKGLKKNEKEPRVLILGLDGAGKTSCLKQISGEDPMQTSPTQGFNVKSVKVDETDLNVWDVGGQENLRTYWSNYFANTDLLMYVIDSADTKRLEMAGVELNKLLEEDQLKEAPVLIFANKQDLENAASPDEIAKTLSLDSIRSRKWQIQGCSAKTGDGLSEGLSWGTKAIQG
eukprot:TRINITY_DN68058_c6_g1_i1.p1 TRINITY_DN68058_c6_g1~~TRINITY_DN68058_c6_g1_i1.p1  ORF type:complete len:187 (+),score=16.12 TRINITY_DN68058_c6_g1_i1:24-563(+)